MIDKDGERESLLSAEYAKSDKLLKSDIIVRLFVLTCKNVPLPVSNDNEESDTKTFKDDNEICVVL